MREALYLCTWSDVLLVVSNVSISRCGVHFDAIYICMPWSLWYIIDEVWSFCFRSQKGLQIAVCPLCTLGTIKGKGAKVLSPLYPLGRLAGRITTSLPTTQKDSYPLYNQVGDITIFLLRCMILGHIRVPIRFCSLPMHSLCIYVCVVQLSKAVRLC